MRYESKAAGSSLELVVLGLLAALVCSLAFPLLTHLTQVPPETISVAPQAHPETAQPADSQ